MTFMDRLVERLRRRIFGDEPRFRLFGEPLTKFEPAPISTFRPWFTGIAGRRKP